MPSLYLEEKRMFIYKMEERQEKYKQACCFPGLLHLTHTLCPLTFLHDFPFFIKSSIKPLRFDRFIGSSFPCESFVSCKTYIKKLGCFSHLICVSLVSDVAREFKRIEKNFPLPYSCKNFLVPHTH